MDLVTGIATASKCLDVIKALKDIDKQIGEADLKAKAAELLTNVADLKIALVEARQQLLEKDAEIKRLQAAFVFSKELIEVRGFKYEKGPKGTPIGTAFCPRCEAKDGRHFRMTYSRGLVEQQCPECKSKYTHVTGYLYAGE